MAKMPLAEFRPDRPRRSRRRGIQYYEGTYDRPQWTGPVVRLADLTNAERVAIGGRARADYPPCEHHTWRCRGCRQWTMNGAYRSGRCNFCGVPRAQG